MESNHAAIGVAASVMRGAPVAAGTVVGAVAGAHPASVITAIAAAAAAAPRKRRAANAFAASVRGFR